MHLLFIILAALVFGVPLLSYALYLIENSRTGLLPRVRVLCGGSLLLPLLRAAFNSAWSIGLVILAYPLGWLPGPKPQPSGASCTGGLPPVILTHGLYHNASAWFLYRRRLRRAGFADVRTYAYASFFRPFEDIVDGLVQAALRAATDSPTGKVLLVGLSLGGMVTRAAMADARLRGRVAGVLTICAPHGGSVLASRFALGRLARGLALDGSIVRRVNGLTGDKADADALGPGVPRLSLFTPMDNMVLPLSGVWLKPEHLAQGWTEVCAPPVSHVGMLYDRRVVELGAEFLLRAARLPASPGAWPAGRQA